MNSPTETRVTIKKLDAKKQIAYGEVYVPYVPDSQGDFMTPEEIERVAHNFLKKGDMTAIDTEHNLLRNGSAVVESFVARANDPDFASGAWVLGVHIPDKSHWAKAERGEIGGFSMYGTGRRQQRVVEIEIPDDGVLFGKTAATSGNGAHEHMYALDFDDKGNFLGGETDEVNGHKHLIKKGTVTEAGPDGHRHRFSFVENLVKGCSGMTKEQKKWKAIRENKARMKKGDFPGHPFRGNQYTDGGVGDSGQVFRERVSVNAPGGSEWDSSYDAAGSRDGVYAANVGAGQFASRYNPKWKNPEKDTPLVMRAVLQGVFGEHKKEPTEDQVQSFTDYVVARYNQEKGFASKVRGRGDSGRDFLRALAADMFSPHLRKGDFPGHPFRGNQYTDGAGGATDPNGRTLDDHIRAGNAWSGKYDAFHNESQKKLLARDRREREDFLDYLHNTIIPDTIESGRTETARDLKTLAKVIETGKLPRNSGFSTVMDFVGFLRDTLIPDLKEMGSTGYVKDFTEGLKHISRRGVLKEDMTAADMPEPVPQQDEKTCKQCQTPKACRKAGRCLISDEGKETEEEVEDEED